MQGLTITAAALLVALAPFPAAAEPVTDKDMATARDALELHYLEAGIYNPVECRRDRDDTDRGWLFCTAVGGTGEIGGLYMIEPGPVIWAVNGKAIQHIRKAWGSIPDLNLESIKADEWGGEQLDISAALDLFR